MDSQLAVLLLTLLCHLSMSQAWNEAANSKLGGHATGDSDSSAEKRQLVPLPRIGRSLLYAKRQSIIPAPRIGRSDSSAKSSAKAPNAVDCAANPDLCENTGSSSGFAGSNDELVEPIDIQLRAAFIPRLGKRRVYMEEDPRASNDDSKAFHKFVLVPGIGYVDLDAANYAPDQEEDDSEAAQRSALVRTLLENSKRAIPYTPRIGRAVFAPRIGKKATFVPRIG